MVIDNETTGFVNFPGPMGIRVSDIGKTFIYIVAIDFDSDEFSKQTINTGGEYCGDDITPRVPMNMNQLSLISPKPKEMHDKFISSVLVGWSKFSYNTFTENQPWICTFRELTNEGKKLYYSFKKLHYEKDIRILTFNNI